MLARSSSIQHPSGIEVQTPLLVPSFSSRGFGFKRNGGAEVKKIFEVASEFLADTMLVSAYDLHHSHLGPVEHAVVDLTFVDSGGYETSDEPDLSSVYDQPVEAKPWVAAALKEVLDSWPAHIPAVLVSFDSPDVRHSLSDQVESAKTLLVSYPDQLHALLVKPETESQQYVQVKLVVEQASLLSGFDVIGFTEKELGSSILKRMEAVASIRAALDKAGVAAPIHIYGSLDPITSTLYFLSGAEIFDGLTWLRYGFIDGLACYYHNFAALKEDMGIDKDDEFIRGKMMQDNLGYLTKLRNQMLEFLRSGGTDFEIFGHNASLLQTSYERLCARTGRVA